MVQTTTAGRSVTLGINFAPNVAAAIRRKGNRTSSISKVLLDLIDYKKLERLLNEDIARMSDDSCGNQSANRIAS